ncbi:MAG TPA: hypothetical protein VKV20_07270 [Ktedonobacteraceae bacterium]|jgi:hypothetical protein|nr:hypothetical protein [Ktedonobacteraceae bacterium]
MIRDRAERRMYRRSPGRQYGYEYDPLHSSGQSRSGQIAHTDVLPQRDAWSSQAVAGGSANPRTTGLLAPRPDPRRTRQLLRQNILASKSKSAPLVETDQPVPDIKTRYLSPGEDQYGYDAEQDDTLYSRRRARSVQGYSSHSRAGSYGGTEQDMVESEYEAEVPEYLDPDLGIDEDQYRDEDPLERRLVRPEPQYSRAPSRRIDDEYAPEVYERGRRRRAPLEYDEYEEDYAGEDASAGEELEERPTPRKKKKKAVSRRKLLLGAIALGGTAVAAYELAPHVPAALENAGTNIEHQIQDAFNRGVAAGGEAVRKEFINALDDLEGVSLDAAIGAAKLTRTAYDVFVSPIVTLSATIAGDFLSAISLALQTGRGWLDKINYGSATLDALQTVVDSWVKQAHNLPQHWQAATDTDLDGAQSYLRALQRKIQQEQALLNGQATPTAKPKPSSTP